MMWDILLIVVVIIVLLWKKKLFLNKLCRIMDIFGTIYNPKYCQNNSKYIFSYIWNYYGNIWDYK